MKKLCALALIMSSVVVAGHEEGVRWGIGGRAGVAAFTGKILSNTVVNAGDAADNLDTVLVRQDACIYPGATSFQGGAFLELGYRSCNWSYGALVDVNGDTLKKEVIRQLDRNLPDGVDRQDLQYIRIKAPLHIGGDVRAGRYFGDALWYVLLGGEGIRISYNGCSRIRSLQLSVDETIVIGCNGYNDSCNTSCDTACNTSCATSCDNNNCDNNYFWRGALRVGTGIEYNVNDCFNIKLEYRFLWAGKKCLCPVSSEVITNAGLPTPSRFRQGVTRDTLYFRQHVAALMLSYQF